MTDVADKLARRLERTDNHLSIVLSIHLFAEHILDRFLEQKSPIAKRILTDHRTYTFAVKLALVFHMAFLDRSLFDNLAALNGLRNAFAHDLDVDLAKSLERRFVTEHGQPLFPDLHIVEQSIRDDPGAGLDALTQIRQATFGRLHSVAVRHGVHL